MRPRYWRVLTSLMALLVLYGAMASPMSAQEILDARLYYSAIEASQFFAASSPSRVHVYLKHQLLDLLFLSTYSVLAFSMVERVFPSSVKMKLFTVTPGVFDFIETCSIIAILIGAPAELFVGWLGFVTCLKWITGGLLTVVLLGRIVISRSAPIA